MATRLSHYKWLHLDMTTANVSAADTEETGGEAWNRYFVKGAGGLVVIGALLLCHRRVDAQGLSTNSHGPCRWYRKYVSHHQSIRFIRW